MKKGFTLIEMLVVIAILAALMGAAIGGYTHITAAADRAKCTQLVSDTATALSVIFQKNGVWPRVLRQNGATDGRLDKNAIAPLKDLMALSLEGYDRFGIVSPWARSFLKNKKNASLKDMVPGGTGTVHDHILHYALDLDGDGIIEGASVGGESVTVRATVIVWCCGKDGKLEAYSVGRRKDDVYSWNYGQTQNVK